MEEMAKKRVKDSETEQSYLLMHRHINGYGRLFGGQLVAWIDELAGLVGRRHCGHEITTACIDNLNFKHPAFLNDTVVLVGRVTYVGRTSMEVRVNTYVEELATGIRKMINRAYVVMVAIDENGEAIGYQFVRLGKMMEDIRHGKDPKEAYEKNIGTYGRFSAEQGAVKYIDPREE